MEPTPGLKPGTLRLQVGSSIIELSRRFIEPHWSIKGKMIELMRDRTIWISLPEMYSALDARTVGAQAHIRGILNRECGPHQLFIRSKMYSGHYKIRRSCL